jgi:hypothetical protein
MVIIKFIPGESTFSALLSCKGENQKYCAINLSNHFISLNARG